MGSCGSHFTFLFTVRGEVTGVGSSECGSERLTEEEVPPGAVCLRACRLTTRPDPLPPLSADSVQFNSALLIPHGAIPSDGLIKATI